ncbi:TolC family protein [Solidesulfovibrio sp.]|uniref:TolC family protein n=1 Tax=Solidesulfovibrio sp. TaxID=2910990 RepID=UPI002611789E|nr:TolC family protein [Solidesulfovibrio sp.]
MIGNFLETRSARSIWQRIVLMAPIVGLLAASVPAVAAAEPSGVEAYVAEALAQNPDIKAARERAAAGRRRVGPAKSLPDPSISVGYQNDGLRWYTYSNSDDAQWMAGFSQTIPYPGKLLAKGDAAASEADALSIQAEITRFKTEARVRELYYELFLAHKSLELLERKEKLLAGMEQTALARYGAGTGSTQDVLMAQSEKYQLLERRESLKQRLKTQEAMLAEVLGRRDPGTIPPPAEPPKEAYSRSLDELLGQFAPKAPEARSREKMVETADAKVRVAKGEFVPDVTLNTAYASKGFKTERELTDPVSNTTYTGRTQKFVDMWTLGVSVTIPLYFWSKQAEGLKESRHNLETARQELEAARNQIAAIVRDNYAAIKAAEATMALYVHSLGPRSRQDFELSMARYAAGGGDALTVLSRLKNLFDYETEYWGRAVEQQKAVAKLEALLGLARDAGQNLAHAGQAQ